jgi:hypothetical protein
MDKAAMCATSACSVHKDLAVPLPNAPTQRLTCLVDAYHQQLIDVRFHG